MNPGNAECRSSAGDAAAASVACGNYLARHSAYLDGELSGEERSEHAAHESVCASCARYASVLRRGSGMLRELPQIAPSTDFQQRLQHRLYHVRDEAVLSPERSRRAGWLAAAAGFALLAGGTYVIELRDGNSPLQAADDLAGQHAVRLADAWTTPAVPVADRAPLPAFSAYTPVVVRLPLYQPVSHELLAGE